jgi:peptidyl-prolyl cis-trans isomerase SurA
MAWRKLLGLSLTWPAVFLVGCASNGKSQVIQEHADVQALLGDNVDPATLVRGQKPDRLPDAPTPVPPPARQTTPVVTTAASVPAKPQISTNPLAVGPEVQSNPNGWAARIAATVNGEAILDEEVNAAAYQYLPGARSDAERNEILKQQLNQIIDREVVLQDAFEKLKDHGQKFITQLEKAARQSFEHEWMQKIMKANGYTDEKLFRKFLRDNHMPLDLIRRQWERNFIAMEYMRHRTEPAMTKIGHLQIMEYYNAHADEFKVDDSLTWQDLFISNYGYPSKEEARQFAEVLAGRIRKGEDFTKLAREFDRGVASLHENAEGVGHKRGEINPSEVEKILFQLKEGQVGPIVEIHTGYHIVRVVKREYAGRMPFDEKVQKLIRDKLKNEVFVREMKRIVADLKRRAEIIIAPTDH